MNPTTIKTAIKCASSFGNDRSTYWSTYARIGAASTNKQLRLWSTNHHTLIELRVVTAGLPEREATYFERLEDLRESLAAGNGIPAQPDNVQSFPAYEHVVSRNPSGGSRGSWTTKRMPLLNAIRAALKELPASQDRTGFRMFEVTARGGRLRFILEEDAFVERPHKEIGTDIRTPLNDFPRMKLNLDATRRILLNMRGKDVTISWETDDTHRFPNDWYENPLQLDATAKVGGTEVRFLAVTMPIG